MSKSKEGLYLTASQVDKAVRELYEKSGCFTLSEVRNGTGFERRQTRTADMLIMSTWPSRGLFAEGVEIKVSKSDLRSELANPKKAEDIAKYCARWWLATPEGLTDGEAIPAGWGIIHVGDKLKAKIIRQAGHRESVTPMDILFVCAVLRNFSESYIHVDQINDRVDVKVAEKTKWTLDRNERAVKDLEELRSAIAKWEKDHGLKIHDYGGHLNYKAKEIGATVALLMGLRQNPATHLLEASEALAAASRAIAPLLGGSQ